MAVTIDFSFNIWYNSELSSLNQSLVIHSPLGKGHEIMTRKNEWYSCFVAAVVFGFIVLLTTFGSGCVTSQTEMPEAIQKIHPPCPEGTSTQTLTAPDEYNEKIYRVVCFDKDEKRVYETKYAVNYNGVVTRTIELYPQFNFDVEKHETVLERTYSLGDSMGSLICGHGNMIVQRRISQFSVLKVNIDCEQYDDLPAELVKMVGPVLCQREDAGVRVTWQCASDQSCGEMRGYCLAPETEIVTDAQQPNVDESENKDDFWQSMFDQLAWDGKTAPPK
ncbi:TPA: hypothetical protein DF272_02240 [Candidatus Falkowbacteria bacterium]|nr:hypothetical protein [Candidatus Falkowbacteria bacterium]